MKEYNAISPKHYEQGKYTCFDEMISLFGEEAVKHFCMLNIYKYRYRANLKNGDEDLKKSEFYMDYLIHINDNIK